jgi:hypothetical protein
MGSISRKLVKTKGVNVNVSSVIKKLFEFIGKEEQLITLEFIREAELKLMADPLAKQLYYPCLHDICEQTNTHYVSASAGQRLQALAIVKDWN